ncbi:MAG: WecB/TagA/CpsF family glycosyltransferase [Clostridia bacterium]|nr:WecB/TagA/CpsF family glycosyltransferase [Clostridia bacterium]
MDKINVRGLWFENLTLSETLSALLDRLESGRQTVLFTPNAEIVQACVDDPALYPVVGSADMLIPDGIGVVKAAKILGTPLKEKVPGVVVGEKLAEALAARPAYRLFLLGGKPGVALTAAEKLTEKYPGLQIAGTHDGYFKKEGEENEAVLESIRQSKADVLYVCLGAPAQEKWIYANREFLPDVKILAGLGGSVDIYAGTAKRAPKIFITLGLEWFYRLLREPKRIGRMMNLPKFYFGTWIYKLSGRKEQ